MQNVLTLKILDFAFCFGLNIKSVCQEWKFDLDHADDLGKDQNSLRHCRTISCDDWTKISIFDECFNGPKLNATKIQKHDIPAFSCVLRELSQPSLGK